MTPREKLARVIAMHEFNQHNDNLRARLPLLLEGAFAKAPYFEVVQRSGVSVAQPSKAHTALADRILARYPDIKDIVERE